MHCLRRGERFGEVGVPGVRCEAVRAEMIITAWDKIRCNVLESVGNLERC